MSRKSKSRRKKRRSESDILISTLQKLPKSKPLSINQVAKRSGSTWRTAKKNLQVLEKAGIVKIGGNDTDSVYALAVDSLGNSYITGNTLSNDFPVTAGANDTSYNGGQSPWGDAFICKLNSKGNGTSIFKIKGIIKTNIPIMINGSRIVL